jgi:protoheme IX farnesyltransferase
MSSSSSSARRFAILERIARSYQHRSCSSSSSSSCASGGGAFGFGFGGSSVSRSSLSWGRGEKTRTAFFEQQRQQQHRRCHHPLLQQKRRAFSSSISSTTTIAERIRNGVQSYKDLSKFKLSVFVVSTAAAGAVLGTTTESREERKEKEEENESTTIENKIKTILDASLGTALCAFSANSLNQILERKQDGMMARTMRRPLPSGRLSLGNAVAFAVASGISGTWYLNEYTNETTAMLGGGNILLYAFVYTPLKQVHWLNTWVGAVVGAIPPMMGYAAAADLKLIKSNSNDDEESSHSFLREHFAKGMVLPLAVYLWQMPHFMALATMGRDDYIKGGYRMLTHPSSDPTLRRAANVAVRNSLMLLPLGFIAANVGLVSKDSSFRHEAIALGAPLVATALMFRQKANITSARRMFYGSLAYLPLFQTALCIRNRQHYYNHHSDDERNKLSDDTSIARYLMAPFIALHDVFAVDDSCPQVALAEEKEEGEEEDSTSDFESKK